MQAERNFLQYETGHECELLERASPSADTRDLGEWSGQSIVEEEIQQITIEEAWLAVNSHHHSSFWNAFQMITSSVCFRIYAAASNSPMNRPMRLSRCPLPRVLEDS